MTVWTRPDKIDQLVFALLEAFDLFQEQHSNDRQEWSDDGLCFDGSGAMSDPASTR
jgi:hypothetical protein